MALWEMAVVVLALLGILWTILLLRLLRGWQDTSQRLERLLGELEANLGPILSQARDTSYNLQRVFATLATGLARASHTAALVGGLGNTVRGGVASLLGGLAHAVPLPELSSKLRGRLGVLRRAFRRRHG